MGFKAELRLLYPDRKVIGPEKTVWMAKETISFGYITRLQKLVEHVREYDPHVRAGICMFHTIHQKLVDKLVRRPQWPDFAPPFLLYKSFEQQHEVYEVKKTSQVWSEFVDAGMFNPKLEVHNQFLTWEHKKLQEFVAESYNIILDRLVMWEASSTVVQWLDEAEAAHAPEWQELQKEPVALAKVCGWREYLRHVGNVEARIMFQFPY